MENKFLLNLKKLAKLYTQYTEFMDNLGDPFAVDTGYVSENSEDFARDGYESSDDDSLNWLH